MMRAFRHAFSQVRAGWWWALGVAALLAGLIYIVLNWYIIVDRDDWVGMQGEASTNAYLAMQRTVEVMGAKTKSIKGDDDWDANLNRLNSPGAEPKNTTLLLGDRRLVRMTPARVAQIREWVRAGGHLIVEAEQPKFDDPLLVSYGIGHVAVQWTPKGFIEKREKGDASDGENNEPEDDDPFGINADDTKDDRKKDGAEKTSPLPRSAPKLMRQEQMSTVTLTPNATFDVAFQPYQNLRVKKLPDDAQVIDDEVGTRLIQFRDGLGRVTAISNFDFMTWRMLGKHDHAEFLWHIVATQNTPPDSAASAVSSAAARPLILLALRDRGGGLWVWLGEHAWMALWAFAALLVAWIARMVRRFGPLRGDAAGARLSLGEHLHALGQYLARQQAWPSLAHAARERFLKRLYRERPGLSRADRTVLLAALEKLTGMGVARIERAMIATVTDKASFVDTIRSLKSMEAALDHHRGARKISPPVKT